MTRLRRYLFNPEVVTTCGQMPHPCAFCTQELDLSAVEEVEFHGRFPLGTSSPSYLASGNVRAAARTLRKGT